MNWNFDNDRPIYKQLIEKLQIFIITGKYPPGERLPSVRDLAIETKVNPNTMQKAMVELETSGLVYSKRTSGRYVTEDMELIKKVQRCLASDYTHTFIMNMKELEIDTSDIVKYIEEEKNNDKTSRM